MVVLKRTVEVEKVSLPSQPSQTLQFFSELPHGAIPQASPHQLFEIVQFLLDETCLTKKKHSCQAQNDFIFCTYNPWNA